MYSLHGVGSSGGVVGRILQIQLFLLGQAVLAGQVSGSHVSGYAGVEEVISGSGDGCGGISMPRNAVGVAGLENLLSQNGRYE